MEDRFTRRFRGLRTGRVFIYYYVAMEVLEGMLVSCYSGFFLLARVHVVRLRPEISVVSDIGGGRIYTNGDAGQIWKQLHVSTCMLGVHRCQRFEQVHPEMLRGKLPHRDR